MHPNSETTANSRYGEAIVNAAAAPAVLTALFLTVQIAVHMGQGLPVIQALPGIAAVSLIAFLVAFLHAAILGRPVMLFLERAGLANAFTAIMAGLAIGALPIGLLLLSTLSVADLDWEGLSRGLRVIGVAALCGGVGGLSAWLTLSRAPPAEWRWNTAFGVGTVAFAVVAIL